MSRRVDFPNFLQDTVLENQTLPPLDVSNLMTKHQPMPKTGPGYFKEGLNWGRGMRFLSELADWRTLRTGFPNTICQQMAHRACWSIDGRMRRGNVLQKDKSSIERTVWFFSIMSILLFGVKMKTWWYYHLTILLMGCPMDSHFLKNWGHFICTWNPDLHKLGLF